MAKTIEGSLDARGLRFGIITTRVNEFMGERLLAGALECLKKHGAAEEQISVVKTQGSFEIPIIAQQFMRQQQCDALICLAVLIRGGTSHFQLLAAEVTRALSVLSLEHNVPVGFGIVTVETLEQAIERTGSKQGNRGWMAAEAAIEQASLVRLLAGS